MATWNTNTSTLSAVNIGLTNTNDRHAELRRYFKEEAGKVTDHMKGVHYARKLPDMQVQYGSTVEKLSKIAAEKPVYQQREATDDGPMDPWHHGESSKMKYKDFQQTMSQVAHKEHDFNERRLRYNKEMGRKATVDGIISGTGPIPKIHLFAQGQSHTAILAQTGSLAMPDARKEPPYVPRSRRWLGDGVGYSNVPPSPRDPDYATKLAESQRINAQRQEQTKGGRPF